ncbi:MAG: hypothetical protein Q8L52_01235 [bacterium]|nr:hypothetical protein [bacterium]
MLSTTQIAALFASALLVAIADSLIKRITLQGGLVSALSNPWTLIICVLYFIQIVLAIYIFVYHGELAVYSNIFIVFYSIFMIMSGVLFFGEQLSMLQYVGIFLALAGAVLINS